MEGYKIFSLRLARVLCDQGFKMIGTVPNAHKPWYDVYVFEDSDALRQAVSIYQEGCRNAR